MLKLLSHNAVDFENGISLGDAFEVRVTREINDRHILEFSYPINEKAESITENKIVVCEGQAYRIIKTSKNYSSGAVMNVECHHVYNADAPNIHIQNVPDMMGVNPVEVLTKVFSGTAFKLLSDTELSKLGMKRVDYDGFMIDFFSMDKTNPYEVVKAVIQNCGKGEIYTDNYKLALVERIGNDTKLRLDLTKNMQNIAVERDITDMVTRLYPYGKDDVHIGSVNSGNQYIQSSNANTYGVRAGYVDFSDYTEPKKLMRRALWEFDSKNEDRIDVPCVNITGSFVDISKLSEYGDSEKIHIGDTLTVVDNGNEISERVIKIEYYPYQSDSSVISIGRVKRDLFFYLEQMGILTKRYKKVSTNSGKVSAQAVAGVISNSGLKVTSEFGTLSVLSDLLKISTGNILKAQIGNQNGTFVFKVMDNSGNTAINIDSVGKMSFTGDLYSQKITSGENVIETDSDGHLCINGKKIVTEE